MELKLDVERGNVDKLEQETKKLIQNIERVTMRAKYAEKTLDQVGEQLQFVEKCTK